MPADLSISASGTPESWNIGPALIPVKEELERLGAKENVGLYLSIIETHADQVGLSTPPMDLQSHAGILTELTRLIRKLTRSTVTKRKVEKELSNLSHHAQIFLKLELTRHLKRTVDLETENWSTPRLLNSLIESTKHARRWVRQSPGQKTHTETHAYCRAVMLVYTQIINEHPGVGGNALDPEYMTPFERLWHASLLLVRPNATIIEAREVHRRASNRR